MGVARRRRAYLKDYASHHDLRLQLSSAVTSIDRRDSRWVLETSNGSLLADAVVIATGYNREPVVPQWPGATTFEGELVHSSAYRNGARYIGKTCSS